MKKSEITSKEEKQKEIAFGESIRQKAKEIIDIFNENKTHRNTLIIGTATLIGVLIFTSENVNDPKGSSVTPTQTSEVILNSASKQS